MNPKFRVWAVLLLVFLLALGIYFFEGRGSSEVTLIGTVDANQVIVSSQVAGRIDRLPVDEGQSVKQGELIAEIDHADLQAERDSARSDLNGLQSQVLQSRDSYASTHGETDANVANAEAALKAAQATLEESQANERQQELNTKRTVALADAGVDSQQDRDNAVETLQADQARVRNNQDQVNAARASLETSRAHLNQAKAALNSVAATRHQMASAQAKLDEAQVHLGYSTVVAPVDGIVNVRAARPGEVVNVGTPIVSLVDLTQTWVYFSIPETQEQAIKLGDWLQVRMPAGEVVPGRVIAKDTQADFATERDYSRTKRDIRTVQVKLLIANPREMYVPGMTAEVVIPKRLWSEK